MYFYNLLNLSLCFRTVTEHYHTSLTFMQHFYFLIVIGLFSWSEIFCTIFNTLRSGLDKGDKNILSFIF